MVGLMLSLLYLIAWETESPTCQTVNVFIILAKSMIILWTPMILFYDIKYKPLTFDKLSKGKISSSKFSFFDLKVNFSGYYGP